MMIKKISMVVGLCLIITSNLVSAKQSSDSLFIKVQQAKNADEKIRAYTNVILFYSARNIDSSIYFADQALTLFQQANDRVSEGRVYHTLANIYKDRLSYDTSLNYINKAFVLFNSINYDKGIAKCYSTQGIIAAQKSEYKTAANYFMRALKLSEKMGDVNGMVQGYANMGSIYGYLNNHQKAIYYFQKAQELNQREFGVSYYKIFGNLASAYFNLGKYEMALSYYKICIDKYEEIAVEMDDYIVYLTEAGDCERELNNIPGALNYYNTAYPMAVEADLQMQQADILLQLAQLNAKLKNYNLVIELADKSIKIAKKNDLLDLLVLALEIKSNAYSQLNKYDLAFSSFKEYNVVKDSLQNYEQKKDVELLEADYKVEKSQAEIDKLELKNQKSNLTKSIYLILLFSFIVIAIILFTSLKKRNTFNKILEQSNKVKDRLLSIIAHDLKSPLSNIVNVLDAIDQGLFTKEEQNEVVVALKNQTNVTIETLENLLKWGQAQLRGIQVKPEKFKLKDQLNKAILFVSAQANSKKIKIVYNQDNDWNGHFDQEHFNFIVRNYLANAIKFSPEESIIEVKTELDNHRNIFKISIVDRGMGIKEEDAPSIFQPSPKVNYGTNNEHGSGLGLRLCKEFAEANNGSVGFNTKVGEGSEFFFTGKAA